MLRLFSFAPGLTLPWAAVGDSEPWMEWDPKTIADCTWWWDNYDRQWSCTEVRDVEYRISPDDFHRWNPSITVDCGNWNLTQSYCVVVESERKPTTSTSLPTVVEATTSVISPPRPTPTAWEALGCFVHDPQKPVFNQSILEGSADLTIEKCENACWSAGFNFAGLKGGLDCLCADFAGVISTKNQSDCNSPCPGDPAEACGGSTAVNAFMGQTRESWKASTGMPSSVATSLSSPASVTATTSSASTPGPSQASIQGWRRMGCYIDDGNLFISKVKVQGGLSNFTRQTCFDSCGQRKYKYAGVENGYDCWCDNSSPVFANSPVGSEEWYVTVAR